MTEKKETLSERLHKQNSGSSTHAAYKSASTPILSGQNSGGDKKKK